MPTISPPRTPRLARRSGVPAWPEVETPSSDSTTSPLVEAGRTGGTISWPHISRAISADDGRAGRARHAPATRPWRSTTQRWVSARTSLSLCEMKMMPKPLRRHGAQRHEQAVDLGRRQHRGRLVEDQDAHAAKQRLDDLQPLLLADRQRRRRAGRDRAPGRIAARCASRPASPPARSSRPPLPGRPTSRLSSTRQPRREVEMLVHHADAGGERIGGRAGCAPACLRPRCVPASALVDAEQDVHQRRLAGAVLAEQAEDLAGRKHEIDIRIGANAAKTLRDAAHFDEGTGVKHGPVGVRIGRPSPPRCARTSPPLREGEDGGAVARSSPRESGEVPSEARRRGRA